MINKNKKTHNCASIDKDANRVVGKQDLVHIVILLAITLGIGIYLITTTVLIAKDGIFYIKQAQKFSNDPIDVIKLHPPGYPFLIFVIHKLIISFCKESSIYTWIYSAQSISLLCRLLAIIPLYFIGKFLVGVKESYWAILILVMLPHLAQFGSDTLREWPHMLFLATGFLLLIWASSSGKWWAFGPVGLIAGLGYLVRVECAQLIVYAILWLVANLFFARRNMSCAKLFLAMVLLVIGFAVAAGWEMGLRGTVLPPKLEKFIDSFGVHQNVLEGQMEVDDRTSATIQLAEFVPGHFVLGSVGKGLARLCNRVVENLMYFFVAPLAIGLFVQIRRKPLMSPLQFIVITFILLNVSIMLLLYREWGYISQRHVMPLTAFMIFYVPVGLHSLAEWLESLFSKNGKKGSTEKGTGQFWFYVLLITGLVICMPKLVRPMRNDKKVYREVSKWLAENTAKEDLIIVPDMRIGFYAERKCFLESYCNTRIPRKIRYIVRLYDDKNEIFLPLQKGKTLCERYSLNYLKRHKQVRIVIYEVAEDTKDD